MFDMNNAGTFITTDKFERSEEDIIAEETEKIFNELSAESVSLFTVGELFWLHHWVTKVRYGRGIEFEKALRKEANVLKTNVRLRQLEQERKGELK